jgi:hypothetical protein
MSEGGEFSHLLDETDVPASDAVLRSIVVRSLRHRERRLRTVAVTASVIAVAAAIAAGVAEATSGTPATRPSAARSNSWTKRQFALGRAPKGLEWAATSKSGPNAFKPGIATPGPDLCTVDGCSGYLPYPSSRLQSLFDRSSGDVTVRVFSEPLVVAPLVPYVPAQSTTGATGATPVTTSCEASQALVVEVSNPGAIGEVTVPLPRIDSSSVSQPFDLIDSTVVGVAESSPIEVVTAYLGTNASSVRANFPDGWSDQMTVIHGWVVLVDDGTAPLPATLVALDGSGAAIHSATVSSDDEIAEAQQCVGASAGSSASTSSTAAG